MKHIASENLNWLRFVLYLNPSTNQITCWMVCATQITSCMIRHAESLNPSTTRIWIFRNFRKCEWLMTYKFWKIRNDLQHYWINYKISNWFRTFSELFPTSSYKKWSFIEFKLIVSTNPTVFHPLTFRNLNFPQNQWLHDCNFLHVCAC